MKRAATGAIQPAQSALALTTAGAHPLRDVFGETLAAEMIRDIADLCDCHVSRLSHWRRELTFTEFGAGLDRVDHRDGATELHHIG